MGAAMKPGIGSAVNGTSSDVIPVLQRLYRHPLYVYLFTVLRIRLAAYAAIEPYVPASGRILDVGCGYGIFSNYLAIRSAARTVQGIDRNRRKLQYADKRVPNASFSVADLFHDRGEAPYDCLLFLHVLHHLSSFAEQAAVVRRCRELLGDHGHLLVLEVDRRPRLKFALAWLADHFLYLGDSIYYRDQRSFARLFGDGGFDTEVIPMHRGLLYPQILYVCRKR